MIKTKELKVNKLALVSFSLGIATFFFLASCDAGERDSEEPRDDDVEENIRAGSPESFTPSQLEPAPYLPLESFLDGNTTHLKFRRDGGYVTINYYGTVAFVESDDSSATTMLVRPERVRAFRLDLHMADTREFSQGDIIEISIEGQFPGSPASFGAVVEDPNIFYGRPTGHTQRDYLEEVLFSGFGTRDHILYTLAVHRRS